MVTYTRIYMVTYTLTCSEYIYKIMPKTVPSPIGLKFGARSPPSKKYLVKKFFLKTVLFSWLGCIYYAALRLIKAPASNKKTAIFQLSSRSTWLMYRSKSICKAKSKSENYMHALTLSHTHARARTISNFFLKQHRIILGLLPKPVYALA